MKLGVDKKTKSCCSVGSVGFESAATAMVLAMQISTYLQVAWMIPSYMVLVGDADINIISPLHYRDIIVVNISK